MVSSPDLSDLQLAIVRVLWDKREASATQVQTALKRSRPLAITTGTAITGVIRNLFRGNPSEVVGQILSERDVSDEDLARMRSMIEDARSAERKKPQRKHHDGR